MPIYIKTRTGGMLDLENPDPANLKIEDIAHALTFICRGSGQTSIFFPVARHCVLCAREAAARGYGRELQLACLLHDASEAYMMDIPRPLKRGLLPEYIRCEDNLLSCIYRTFLGRPLTAEEQRQVKEIDDDLLQWDLKYLLDIDTVLPPLRITIDYRFEPFDTTREAYLSLFRELARQEGA